MTSLKTSDSFIQFVRDTREQSKVSKLLFKYYHPTSNWSVKTMARHITGETINYLTFRKDGTISFLPKGKELTLTNEGQWSREGRQEGKPARIIQQVFSYPALRTLTPRDFEIFSNLYKGRATSLYDIKTATGREIWEIYQKESTFNSCMLGASQEKLKIYTENESVSLLYVTDGSKILARALCWTDNEGNKIVDRVYGDEMFIQMFRDYAVEIGAYKKHCDSAGESMFLLPDGKTTTDKRFFIPVDVSQISYYPYIDTFHYLNATNGWLSNEEEDAEFELQNTGGDASDLRGWEVHGRSGRYDREEIYWSDDRDAYIHEDDAVYVRDCYYYDGDVSRDTAFAVGHRRWVLTSDCKAVDCFDADEFTGITRLNELNTFTQYADDKGNLWDIDNDAVEVWVHDDGRILGECED